MAHVANVNFRLDSDVKKSMEQACADMGISMTTAFTIFAKKLQENAAFHLKFLQIRFIRRRISVIWKQSCVISRKTRLILQNTIC